MFPYYIGVSNDESVFFHMILAFRMTILLFVSNYFIGTGDDNSMQELPMNLQIAEFDRVHDCGVTIGSILENQTEIADFDDAANAIMGSGQDEDDSIQEPATNLQIAELGFAEDNFEDAAVGITGWAQVVSNPHLHVASAAELADDRILLPRQGDIQTMPYVWFKGAPPARDAPAAEVVTLFEASLMPKWANKEKVFHYASGCTGGDAPNQSLRSMLRAMNTNFGSKLSSITEYASEHPTQNMAAVTFVLANDNVRRFYKDEFRITDKGGPTFAEAPLADDLKASNWSNHRLHLT
jgi:hypothetical protein